MLRASCRASSADSVASSRLATGTATCRWAFILTAVRAVVMRRFGRPDVLQLEAMPRSEPASDEVLAGHDKVVIGAIRPLEKAPRGHELVASSEVIGNVILDPNGIARTRPRCRYP